MAKHEEDPFAEMRDVGIGHNSGEPEDANVAAEELRSFIERVERLEEEKKQTAEDIKDVYGEAKGRGYDAKVLRAIVTLRKQDANERREFKSIMDTYLLALGIDVDDI